ncbi:hypothetical protein [Latilactobacillus sakei]|uniref:hypothetical protein n=1 Tax=Latilactobacillus sakei TaxID=1599 RepID=UPI001CFBBDB1|nr:hypothetical protein [Latilactobacillus sakei]
MMKKIVDLVIAIIVLLLFGVLIFRFVTDFKKTLLLVTVLAIAIILKHYIRKK